MKKILLFLTISFFIALQNQVCAQINAGPVLGVNLSRLEDFTTNKQMLRPGLYAGLTGSYQINKWLSFGIEAAWSEKHLTYQNSNTFSAFEKLQGGLQFIYPEFPDISELFELITGTTGLTLNDTAFETRTGLITFKTIEVPLTARFHYKKFRFDVGGYGSFLIGANTTETFEQDVPLFEVISPTVFDTLSPFISTFIYSTFPGLNGPDNSENSSTSGFASMDYGLTGGITYMPDDFLTIGISYSHGLAQKLSSSLPDDKSHAVFRFSITYNLFGKVIQKPSF